jgi:3',5'-cyclic AMP phosphodiesterase CpdA
MTRRDLLKFGSLAFLPKLDIPLPILPAPRKALKFAVITDLHFGLAPDAMSRANAFIDAVNARKDLSFVLQMGDFCYSDAGAQDLLEKYKEIKLPTVHVLGNHDMDKVTKPEAVARIGMKSPYRTHDFGDYRFVVLDLNNFKKNGELVSYANGNYFTDNATHNWADAEQLAWFEKTLTGSKKPVILISHQPLGFAEPGQPLPPEQQQIIDIVNRCAKANPKGAVALSMFGHLHVDRLEHVDGIPYYCVNSASYFWSSGMWAYSKPLFSFMELTSDGRLVVEGVEGEFVKTPPKASDSVIGRSASISNRKIPMNRPR